MEIVLFVWCQHEGAKALSISHIFSADIENYLEGKLDASHRAWVVKSNAVLFN